MKTLDWGTKVKSLCLIFRYEYIPPLGPTPFQRQISHLERMRSKRHKAMVLDLLAGGEIAAIMRRTAFTGSVESFPARIFEPADAFEQAVRSKFDDHCHSELSLMRDTGMKTDRQEMLGGSLIVQRLTRETDPGGGPQSQLLLEWCSSKTLVTEMRDGGIKDLYFCCWTCTEIALKSSIYTYRWPRRHPYGLRQLRAGFRRRLVSRAQSYAMSKSHHRPHSRSSST